MCERVGKAESVRVWTIVFVSMSASVCVDESMCEFECEWKCVRANKRVREISIDVHLFEPERPSRFNCDPAEQLGLLSKNDGNSKPKFACDTNSSKIPNIETAID